MPAVDGCRFCRIAEGQDFAHVVLADEVVCAFLDHRPVFLGHVLVVPRLHVVTLPELPAGLVGPLFASVQRVTAAVQAGLGAEGSFVALNNIVSQSVAHLHVHVVPRRHKDGLRGFFWPRVRYRDDHEMAEVASRIAAAVS
ncbi:MAG TPA: HIT family protein [Acidimicrobiales bacterium]